MFFRIAIMYREFWGFVWRDWTYWKAVMISSPPLHLWKLMKSCHRRQIEDLECTLSILQLPFVITNVPCRIGTHFFFYFCKNFYHFLPRCQLQAALAVLAQVQLTFNNLSSVDLICCKRFSALFQSDRSRKWIRLSLTWNSLIPMFLP